MSRRAKGIIPEYKSLEEILREAIEHEQESHDYYLEASERTANPDLRQFLEQLARVELTHKKQLEEALRQVQAQNATLNDLLYAFGEQPV